MLKAHFNACEKSILALSDIAQNTGHPIHKGTPREIFIQEFLEDHISENIGIGTGEIFDSNSSPNDKRNQNDIILYNKSYPKLKFGGKIHGYLAESVISTIEVKSTLTKEGLKDAIEAAIELKSLERSISYSFKTGYIPPSILNYVVAYDGPAKMETVDNWLKTIHSELNISEDISVMSIKDRLRTPSPSIDGIFLLGKGRLIFNNTLFGPKEIIEEKYMKKWAGINQESENLLFFFMILTAATGQGISGSWLNPEPYF